MTVVTPDRRYTAHTLPASLFRSRREKLARSLGEGVVLLLGAADPRGMGDVAAYSQNPLFYYLTGVELPGAILLVGCNPYRECLLLPPRDPEIERWTGPKWGPGEEAAKNLGFDEVSSVTPWRKTEMARVVTHPGLGGTLRSMLDECGYKLWVPVPPLEPDSSLSPELELLSKLRDRFPSFSVGDLLPAVNAMRSVKEDAELELIKKAVAATIAGQRQAAASIRPGAREKAVEGAVFAAMMEAGGEGLAFDSIIASGPAATVLHYDQNIGVCQEGELVVVDIGARVGHYCGDLTRTYPVSRRFTQRQRDLYMAVLEAQLAVEDAMKPGKTIADLRLAAYNSLKHSPVKGPGGTPLCDYFIHNIGHHLGLEAHDPEGPDPKLKPGAVITNEPGVYIPEEGIGIRIEDDYVITENGAENLSARLPKDPDKLLEMMG